MPPAFKALNVALWTPVDPRRLRRRRPRHRPPPAAARPHAQDAARRARLGRHRAGAADRDRPGRRMAAGAPARSTPVRRHRRGAPGRRRAALGRSRRAAAPPPALAARARHRRRAGAAAVRRARRRRAPIACARRRSPSPAPPARSCSSCKPRPISITTATRRCSAAATATTSIATSTPAPSTCPTTASIRTATATRRRATPPPRPPFAAVPAVGAARSERRSSSPSTRCAPITSAPTATRGRPRRASTRSRASRSRFANGWAHAPSTRYSVPAILDRPLSVDDRRRPRGALAAAACSPRIACSPRCSRTAATTPARSLYASDYFEPRLGPRPGLRRLRRSLADAALARRRSVERRSGSSARSWPTSTSTGIAEHTRRASSSSGPTSTTPHFVFERHPDMPDRLRHRRGRSLRRRDPLHRPAHRPRARRAQGRRAVGQDDRHRHRRSRRGLRRARRPQTQRHGYHLYAQRDQSAAHRPRAGHRAARRRRAGRPRRHLPDAAQPARRAPTTSRSSSGRAALGLMLGATPDDARARLPGGLATRGRPRARRSRRRATGTSSATSSPTARASSTTSQPTIPARSTTSPARRGAPSASSRRRSARGWTRSRCRADFAQEASRATCRATPYSPSRAARRLARRARSSSTACDVPARRCAAASASTSLLPARRAADPRGWRLFAHVVGPTGRMLNADHEPVEGTMPLARLRPGTFVRDRIHVTLPPDWPVGTDSASSVGLWRGTERAKAAGAARRARQRRRRRGGDGRPVTAPPSSARRRARARRLVRRAARSTSSRAASPIPTTSSGWKAACCATRCASSPASRSTRRRRWTSSRTSTRRLSRRSSPRSARSFGARLQARPLRLARRLLRRRSCSATSSRAAKAARAPPPPARMAIPCGGLRADRRVLRPGAPRLAVPRPRHRRPAVGWWKRRSPPARVAAALLLVAAFFVKQTAAPFMVALGLALLARHAARRRRLRRSRSPSSACPSLWLANHAHRRLVLDLRLRCCTSSTTSSRRARSSARPVRARAHPRPRRCCWCPWALARRRSPGLVYADLHRARRHRRRLPQLRHAVGVHQRVHARRHASRDRHRRRRRPPARRHARPPPRLRPAAVYALLALSLLTAPGGLLPVAARVTAARRGPIALATRRPATIRAASSRPRAIAQPATRSSPGCAPPTATC